MGTWGKWAPENMSTRANRYLRQMGTLEHNGHLAIDGHWEKMGIWGKCTPGKMSTRANQQLGQMGILEPMDIGADGHGHC